MDQVYETGENNKRKSNCIWSQQDKALKVAYLRRFGIILSGYIRKASQVIQLPFDLCIYIK